MTNQQNKQEPDCIKCDRFVAEVNKEGLCPECQEDENS